MRISVKPVATASWVTMNMVPQGSVVIFDNDPAVFYLTGVQVDPSDTGSNFNVTRLADGAIYQVSPLRNVQAFD